MQPNIIRRIVVTTDGSTHSIEAAKYAARLAAQLGARVTLLHVAPATDFPLGTTQLGADLPEPGPEDDIGLVKTVWEGAQAILDDSISVFEQVGVSVDGMVQEGDAAEEILQLLEDDSFDMVVMGRRGAGRSETELGATVSRVARMAKCPVLLVG